MKLSTPTKSTKGTMLRRAASVMLLSSITLLAACASTASHEGAGEYVDDSVITAKVKAAVLGDSSLKSSEINVETFKGRVQLSGFVNSKADVEQAMAVARKVSGVTSVANDMQLK